MNRQRCQNVEEHTWQFFQLQGNSVLCNMGYSMTDRQKKAWLYLSAMCRTSRYISTIRQRAIHWWHQKILWTANVLIVRITAVRCVSSHHNSTIYIVDSTAIHNRQRCSPSCPAHTTKQMPLSILVLYVDYSQEKRIRWLAPNVLRYGFQAKISCVVSFQNLLFVVAHYLQLKY